MFSPGVISCNGDIVPADQARVCLLAPALLHSFGVYESVRVDQSVPFHLSAHLERLANSARLLEFELPASPETIGEWALGLLASVKAQRAALRIVVLGPAERENALCALWCQPSPAPPAALYQTGAEVICVQGTRYLPQAKSLNTLVNFVARRQADRRGAHEALLCDGDMITEGASSNFFVVREGQIGTPPEALVLPGVTRALSLGLARTDGLPVFERPLYLSEHPAWDEAFITSTSRKVLPVTRIEGAPVGGGLVGPATQRLIELFGEYDAEYLQKHAASG